MKKIVFYALIGLSLFTTSCNSLLVEDVRSQITDNYLNTPEGFETAVNASYSHIRTFYGQEEGGALSVFGTDEFTNGYGGTFMNLNFYDSGLNPRAPVLNTLWDNMYIGINNCNAVIGRADKVPGLDEKLKTTRIAEVRFLRAYYYFLLVQTFGPVHISLKESEGVVVTATRSPIKDVYKVITDDLDFAVANLPATAAIYGRVYKSAAEFLLSKVYLTRAGTEAAGTDDHAKAADLAKKVIANTNLSLLPSYAKIFEQGAGEKNSEVVWAIQYSTDLLTTGLGNSAHLYYLAEYDRLPGMQRDIANGRPWVRFKPTMFTVMNLFDRKNDSRYEASFKFVFYSNKPGTYTIGQKQVTFAQGDTAIWVADRELTAAELAKKNYSVYPPSAYNDRIYPTLTKFLDPTRVSVQEMRGSRDFLVFRLAEAYLIAAEGLMMSGKKSEALTYINAVRTRAAKKGSEAAMKVTEDQLTIDFVLDERARELLGEYVRWFDLVRTGKLLERVKKYNPDGANQIRDFHVLRPIPQTQIDRTEGGIQAFPQNKGY
ncbi:RagB/SusD family nutrient uptake outer membrane protein [Larkinella terrae]|uniref:RagB/SusD family nutrient uptake outer membrane protein n=1 Tax=Larkinella terrae TaxID=2025311 RepID=A0A7K0EMN6_9BACT|nr:RagB/SusD family nutrient uptake outer membrane protein [Larkinella terrae]MRS63055.1 RagB/SusD family nutrient uptake outer membrane protein [Larkinella terrae]